MLRIVVPVKSSPQAKSRLAAVLTDAQRRALVEAMVRRTLLVARAAAPAAEIVLVSNSADFRVMAESMGARAIADQGMGFNEALAIADATSRADDAMLVLPADLPLLAAADVAAMLGVITDCAIAPDRVRDGTNALFWRRAPRIFRFGLGSFSAHLRAAREQGGIVQIVERPGLAFDLDDPQDLCNLRSTGFSPTLVALAKAPGPAIARQGLKSRVGPKDQASDAPARK